ncbi:hypothetical protein P170DRAFT_423289 [Aspergillus steynii IBT 23096]|uniref:BZIP domain-containing protein n=1 Tax=Aspergillus steynii IBT 23096 TaxID=1392250 RepID=A0A2I2GHS9_9EURO|nr:uncharacterized protein P170DRAFT_423289 [Aspergillus steynii IBT 23096]PLB52414.1 hypothetical protein P170DRAFT_423289 [Aspergillus steynii IBT 23096]
MSAAASSFVAAKSQSYNPYPSFYASSFSDDLINPHVPHPLSLDSPFNLPGDDFTGLESFDSWAPVTDGPYQPLPAISTPFYPSPYTPAVEAQPSPLQNELSFPDLDVPNDFFPSHEPLTYSEDSTQSQPPPMSLATSTTSSPNSSTPSDAGTTRPKPALSRVEKRQLNTMAARRYRQRRVDQVTQLEAELKKVKEERDALKMRVSKLEGETDALRSLVGRKK